MHSISEYSVIIPLGGEGKRLRPFTKDRSKALVPLFNNVPVTEISIFNVAKKLGLRDFILGVSGYQNYLDIQLYYQGGFGWSNKMGITPQVHFHYQNPSYLDSGSADSALYNIKKFNIKRPVIIFPNDNIFSPDDLLSLVEFSNNNKFDFSIGLTRVKSPEEYGFAKLSTDGKSVYEFLEKPGKVIPKNALVNTGVYVVKPNAFGKLVKDFGKDVLPQLAKEKRLGGFVFKKSWLDFGSVNLHQKSFQKILNKNFDYLLPFLKRTSKKVEGADVWVRGRGLKSIELNKNIRKAILMHKISTKGRVLIGRDCMIGDRVYLESCSIGDMAIIENGAVVKKSNICDVWQIGQGAKIEKSTFARVGSVADYTEIDNSYIGDNVTIGSNLKIKERIIPKHSKVHR